MAETYKRKSKIYRLSFDDPEDGELQGLVIDLKSVSLERMVELSASADELANPKARTKEKIEAQFTAVADLIVAWNLVGDDDQPVPASYDELKKFDFAQANKIMREYLNGLTTPPKDSDSKSPSGGKSEEEQLGLGT